MHVQSWIFSRSSQSVTKGLLKHYETLFIHVFRHEFFLS